MSYKGKNFCFGRNGISEFVGFISVLFLSFGRNGISEFVGFISVLFLSFGRNGISEFVGFISVLFLSFRYLGSPFGAGRGIVVGMATRLRARKRGVRTPVGERNFLFSKALPNRLLGPPSILYNGYQSFSCW